MSRSLLAPGVALPFALASLFPVYGIAVLFGAALGVGYKLESGLNFNVRFQRALNSLYDFGDDVDFSVNWNTINLSVGYDF